MTSTNEYGVVPVLDGEVPRTITVKARENISGGEFVLLSGTGNNPVGSDASTFTSSDFEACLSSAANQVNGIALDDISSGAYGTIATRGTYIVKCGGSVVEGKPIETIASSSVQTLISGPNSYLGDRVCGRALTAGESGTSNYCVASFNF